MKFWTKMLTLLILLVFALMLGTADKAFAQDPDMEGYAGLDQDLSGVTIRMANIGGQPYEAMYDSIKVFEEKTGAKVETVFLGDGFEIDRYLKTNYAAGTVDFDVAWNHTSFMSSVCRLCRTAAKLLHRRRTGCVQSADHCCRHH